MGLCPACAKYTPVFASICPHCTADIDAYKAQAKEQRQSRKRSKNVKNLPADQPYCTQCHELIYAGESWCQHCNAYYGEGWEAVYQKQAGVEPRRRPGSPAPPLENEPATYPEPRETSPNADVAGQLAQLAALRQSGALTDEEFAAAKARILAS